MGKPRRSRSKEAPSSEETSIRFGDGVTIGGDVVGRDKVTISRTDHLERDQFLELLRELKASVDTAPIGASEKSEAAVKISSAIDEVHSAGAGPSGESNIGHYLSETKTILDRFTDVAEIGSKAMPLLFRLGKLIGLAF